MKSFSAIPAALITRCIDFWYDLFEAVLTRLRVSRQLFRYACCGGGNMVLDWVLYFVLYNFVIGHRNITFSLLSLTVSPHILALGIVFPITLLTGFWLNKYVTFTQSTLSGRTQLIRYMEIVAVNLLVNYLGLKLLVDVCGLYPTPSKMLITVVTVAISYFGQKYFSFRN